MGKKFYRVTDIEKAKKQPWAYNTVEVIERCGRWQEPKTAYGITPKNSLWDYATDGYGYHPYQDSFNPAENGDIYLDYIAVSGRKVPLDAMLRTYETEEYIALDGERVYISAYDADGNLYTPDVFECNDCCIRAYHCLGMKDARFL